MGLRNSSLPVRLLPVAKRCVTERPSTRNVTASLQAATDGKTRRSMMPATVNGSGRCRFVVAVVSDGDRFDQSRRPGATWRVRAVAQPATRRSQLKLTPTDPWETKGIAMKLGKWALLAAIAGGISSVGTSAIAGEIQQVSCGCTDPVCGCEPVCDMGCEPECGCEEAIACCDSSCDSGCDSCGCGTGGCFDGLCGLGGLGGDCCHGDPWQLFGSYGGIDVGGWASVGYHTAALPLFNSRPDDVQLHQAWLYAEKALDTSCGFDYGGRIDYIYGTDGPDTQAFGIANDHWDNDFDNGNDYGHAIPQLYGEVGYGDLSVKLGHFYTIIGYEVVGAPGNFFYSHAYTFYNSEPFTHTGALATYNATDDVTLWGGYVLGWDSGFEDNGDAFLGGVSTSLTDDLTLIYTTVAGRFSDGNQNRLLGGDINDPVNDPPIFGGGENGYMQSIVADWAVTDNLNYVFQSDFIDTEDFAGAQVRETVGINQYLFYTFSDCWAVGNRFEWYNSEAGVYNGNNDIYAYTAGVNYAPTANFTLRPEVRWDFVDGDPTDILEDSDDDQFTFGMDGVFTF